MLRGCGGRANDNISSICHNLSNSRSLWTRLDRRHVWLFFAKLNNFQDAGKKFHSAMWYAKIVTVMFHPLYLHTVQNTNSN